MTATAKHRQNIFGFGKKKTEEAPRKRSALTLARAAKLAKEAGYKGTQDFRDWLEAKKLDDHSQEVINRLGQAYRDGMDERERADTIKEKVRDAKRLQKEQREEKKEEGLPVGRMKTDAELKAAFARGLTLYEAMRENPALRTNAIVIDALKHVSPFRHHYTRAEEDAIMDHVGIPKKGRVYVDNPAAFDRCVKAVQKRGGAANAYAVCTAQGKRNPAPKVVKTPYGGFVVKWKDKHGKWHESQDVFLTREDAESEAHHIERTRKNPAEESARVFEEFHGYAPTEIIAVQKKRHYHEWLATAGEFAGIQVRPLIGGKQRRIKIGGESYLGFNEDKNQLFLEGGDQSLPEEELKKFVGRDWDHELLTLGKLTKVGYITDKKHLGKEGGEAVYTHKFRTTNKAGRHVEVEIARYPDLIYRVKDQQLEISGGSYKIKAEGIDL